MWLHIIYWTTPTSFFMAWKNRVEVALVVVDVVKNSSPWRRSRCNCTPPVADSSKASKQESNITFCVKNILLQGSAQLGLPSNLFDHILPAEEAFPPTQGHLTKGWSPQNFGWTTPSFDVTIVPPAIKRHIFASKQHIVARVRLHTSWGATLFHNGKKD